MDYKNTVKTWILFLGVVSMFLSFEQMAAVPLYFVFPNKSP